ncbi:MAG: RNA polymerase sigma factor [Phenylobacterium sp.]|nr:MAG: RNA polymerase sigma factor [Phenylobacterium sp.]
MPALRKPPVDHATLTQDAGSVRSWLARWFARRVRDQAEVEDMVQDVFARIAARDSTEPVEHLGGYVLKTAWSVMADRARRRASHMMAQHVPLNDELHGDEEIDPERVLIGKEDLRAATAALLSLPERTRTVFILRRLEGCRQKEIAMRLGISVSAVEKHLVRAIQHLAAEMERRRGP